MRFTKGLVLNFVILFFINCTAWPLLVPVPPGKTSTTIYPIDLTQPATVPNLRITVDRVLNGAVGTPVSTYCLASNATVNLGLIDKSGADQVSQTLAAGWSEGTSDTNNIVTISTNGAGNTLEITLTAHATNVGTATITATHLSISPAATLSLTVAATCPATSILGFDGQQFLIISGNTNSNEEK